MKRLTRASILAMALLLAASAQAVTIAINNQAAFLAAAGPTTLESFEGLVPDNVSDARSVISVLDFDVTADGMVLSVNSVPAFGQAATHGDNYARVSDNEIDASFALFDFFAPVTAFGLTVIDWGDFGGGGQTLRLSTDSGVLFNVKTSVLPDANTFFFGIVSDMPFSQVRLDNPIAGESFAFDEVYYSSPSSNVPEPTTLALWILGISGVLLGSRRRSH